jgi:hypothetical protein
VPRGYVTSDPNAKTARSPNTKTARSPNTKTARILSGRLPIQVWPNRDGQGYVPERAG